MGLLSLSELKNASNWVFRNAQEILDSVKRLDPEKKADGWKKVFPNGVPTWLHKLRNYFNVEPKCLRLMNKLSTDHAMQDIRSHRQLNSFVGKRTLAGHVYFDEDAETWYQMSAGATIYHWGDDVSNEMLGAIWAHEEYTQIRIPIFKLICRDGTGGSKETIITNPFVKTIEVERHLHSVLEREAVRGEKIGETNQVVPVSHRVVTTTRHQGSYNFSETAVVGLDEHRKSDIKHHKNDPVYINPPDRFAPLKSRIFNEFLIFTAGGTVSKKR